jgi:hypothetical protein
VCCPCLLPVCCFVLCCTSLVTFNRVMGCMEASLVTFPHPSPHIDGQALDGIMRLACHEVGVGQPVDGHGAWV